ncbi:MAG: choice-of-anchor B family protein [Phycisphaerales bacterium]|nr:choice-of-anchor B family protein [Phycisphaerales bacterium]
MKNTTCIAAALLGTGLTVALAHIDDPKEQDRVPRWEGPAFRAAEIQSNEQAKSVRGDFDAENITLMSWLPLSSIGGGSTGSDCWGYTSPSGREYAIICTSSHTVFVEVTDPGNAQVIEQISGPNSLWRDVKTYGQYAYAVSEGGSGIQVMNMGNIDLGIVQLVNTVDDQGTSATHNVAIDTDSGFLYRTGGGDNGLRIYSLADPTTPTYVGSWTARYVHDAQIVTYDSGQWAGKQIAFCCGGFNGGFGESGLCILDVTNKSNIIELACIQHTNPNYSHQGWLSEDRQYFYLNDELDEQNSGTLTTTRIINVADLQNPFQAGTFTSGSTAIDHNLYVKGDIIYEANYRSGLRVFDASNPVDPDQIAYFDTWPGDDGASFNGLWSVYPYFDSGTVVGSDLERGLFVWKIEQAEIEMAIISGEFEFINPDGGDQVVVRIAAVNEGEVDQNSPQLVYASASNSGSVDLQATGTPNEYAAAFPPLTCGETVSWYLTASSTNGQTLTVPSNAPTSTFDDFIAVGIDVAFEDNGETNTGWTASGNALDGQWDRGIPVNCNRGDPPTDYDGSGQCWLTDNSSASNCNSDVDDGATTLVSPMLDGSAPGSVLSYARWYSNNFGADPGNDIFRVDISDNDGETWTTLETVGPTGEGTTGGWYEVSFVVSEIAGILPSDQMRLRFTAEDANAGSVIEAGVDAILISALECSSAPPCPADVAGNDGQVNVNDLLAIIGAWNTSNPQFDIDGNGIVNVNDLLEVIGAWGDC